MLRKILIILFILIASSTIINAQNIDFKNEIINSKTLRKLPLSNIVILRNTIFARHGYKFRSSVLQQHFESKDWYTINKKYSYKNLNTFEIKNIRLLKKEEKKRKNTIIRQITDYKNIKKTKYFLTLNIEKRIPVRFQKIMKHYLESNDMNEAEFVPTFVKVNLINEIDKKSLDKKIDLAMTKDIEIDFYKAGYNSNNELVYIEGCYADYINGMMCGDNYYFYKDRLITISQMIEQTSYGQSWSLNYIGDKVYSISYEFFERGKLAKKKNFYP